MELKNSTKTKKKDEFIIDHSKPYEDILLDEEDLQKRLELDIENDCNSEIKKIYVDKLEIKEIPDKELILLDKQEIMDHKNYQIQKLKAYIVSLEKEKEDLINNFKDTTNFLLEKIKQDEFKEIGVRPQTSQIVDNIIGEKNNNMNSINSNQSRNYINNNDKNQFINSNGFNYNGNNNQNSNNSKGNREGQNEKKKNINVFNFDNNKEYEMARCPNCTKEFPHDKLIAHSLYCLRKNHTCKICKEVIPEEKKKEHIMEWRSIDKIINAIKSNDRTNFKNCIEHGVNPSQIIDPEKGEAIIHYIARYADFKLLEIILGKEIDLDLVNFDKETALFIAIKQKNFQLVKSLVELGIDIINRNSEDLTPLMLSCKLGLIQISEILLTNNANLYEANILGDTPLKLAQRNGHEELVLLLIQKYKALLKPTSKK